MQQDPINKDKAKSLYDAGSKHYDLGSFDEFVVKLESPEKRKLLYTTLSKQFDLGTYDDYENKLKKKFPSFQDEMQRMLSQPASESGQPSTPSSLNQSAPTAVNPFEPGNWKDLRSDAQKLKKQDEAAKVENNKKLVDFYDKVSEAKPTPKQAYKNWSADNGTLDRINYLEEKAKYESEGNRENLSNSVGLIKQFQEQRRAAASRGDMEEYTRLNDLSQQGAEYLRANKAGVEEDLNTDTGLQLWEESVQFTSGMLNAKIDHILKNPETKDKLNRLQGLKSELDKHPTDENLINEYNSILTEPDIAEINKVVRDGESLLQTEKDLAVKYPAVFQKRLDKKVNQEAVDKMFKEGELGIVSGTVAQIDRSATNFLADIAKLPTILDADNKYGWEDKWNDIVDTTVENVNQYFFPTPSDYSKPYVYNDEQGNTVWRNDLLLPKIGKLGGDMAALFFGAGKISKLTQAAGFAKNISSGVGLFTSSYVQTYDDYKKAGEDAGMNPSDAADFAMTSAAATSALELISPQSYLWRSNGVARRVVENITAGMSKTKATTEAIKFFGKQVGAENLQETTQLISDKLIEAGANTLTGNNYFEHNSEDIINEAIETAVLTTIVAGAPATVVASGAQSRTNANYSDAIRIVAENKEKYIPLLQQAFKQSNAKPAEIKNVIAAINAVAVPQSGAPLYIIDGVTTNRGEIEKRMDEGKLYGVYVANDTALQQQLTSVSEGNKIEKQPEPKIETKVKEGEETKELSAEEKAKEVAKAKIKTLIGTGDLKSDGKRVTILTEKGGQELASIMEELNGSRNSAVHETIKEAKSEQTNEQVVKTPEQSQKELNDALDTAEGKRIVQVLEKAKSSLSAIKPDIKTMFYNGLEEGKQALKDAGSKSKLPKGSVGFYDRQTGTIGIDISSADATTAFHESFHPIIDAVKTENPELFKTLTAQAADSKLELADGSISKYGDYMKGNKEEALVEFLADFTDGKFDNFNNHKSIVQQVKDIIEKVLEAVGLKSSDFNIDLNDVKDLKEFADQMATAISKGKTINFDTKSKVKAKGLSPQVPGAKKKLNRTAKRIAFDRNTEFKKLQTDIVTNPDKYSYTPQDLKGKKQQLGSLTLDEVVTETQNSEKLLDALNQNNQYAVLSALELLRRYNAQGQDTRPIFKKLRELGTGVGQLLRQFGELKSRTPEGIVNTVLGNLESMNLTLDETQTKDLLKLANDHINSLSDLDAKRVDFINNPSDQTEKSLEDAEKVVAKSFNDLNLFIGKVTPMGVDSMISTILQGNLLTLKSIATNVISNFIYQPLRQVELFAGDVATYAVHRFKGINPVNPIGMYFGALFNGIQSWGKSVPGTVKDIIVGRGSQFTSTLEVQRNLKPLQALQQIFTKSGRASLPVNTKGKVPLSIYIEKAFEGSVAWPAEAMFRMLYLGDKPFKNAARTAAAYRMFAEQSGKTLFNRGSNAEFRKYLANLNSDQKKVLQEHAEEATFSNKRTLSKIADNFVGMVHNNIEILSEKAPNKEFKYAAKILLKVIAKANTPFVRVPSNLLQYLIELTLWPVALYGSVSYAARGNQRKSAELFVRGAAGVSLSIAADMLYDAGVLLASGEDDEENERQLKHEVGRPNGINIDAWGRFRAGMSPEFKVTDKVYEFSKFGFLGMFLAYRAEFNEHLQKDLKKSRSEIGFYNGAFEKLNSVAGTALEMSFLQGTYNMLKAFDDGGFQDYGAELMNTMTALVIPNQYSAITRARSKYVFRADDKEALNSFIEKQSVKIFPHLEDNITGVYPIIGMFGDPVRQTPKGKNPWFHHFFDISNSETITDPLVVEVFNVSKRVGDCPVSAPDPKIRLFDKSYRLTEQDYTYLQMMSGRYKRIVMQQMISDPEWKNMTDQEKSMAMAHTNETANSSTREYMVAQIYEGIEVGKIMFDERMGTYSYKETQEFDFDYAKKLLEE